MGLDIDILLALQNFRNGIGGGLAEFFSKMTFFGEVATVPVILAIIYWCINKTYGTYLMMGWGGVRIANGLLKVTACAYRPWIRDARVVPYGNAINTATGYSFPSGHTMNAATIFGGGVVYNRFPRFLRIAMFLMVLRVAFSRVYLGVHTPQDVLVGMGTGLLVMWLTLKLLRCVEKHPEKDWWVVGIGLLLAAGTAVYAALKPYPVDYDADGKLLVDGVKMANDTFKSVGWTSAILVGWVLERRYVKFTTEGLTMTQRAARLVVGLIGYYVVSLIVCPLLKGWIPGMAGTIITCFLQMFFISFIFPWCMKFLDRKIPAVKIEKL